MNNKPFQKLPGCRSSAFKELDKPALKALPTVPYEYTKINTVTVAKDYHIPADNHYYSVPYKLVKKKVEVRISSKLVAIFYRGEKVATHIKHRQEGGASTNIEHMSKAHRAMTERTPEKMLEKATAIGVATREVVQIIINEQQHAMQSCRICTGILVLIRKYGPERLENACCRALQIKSCSRQSIISILQNGLDQDPIIETCDQDFQTVSHDNLRDTNLYH